jgi:hypothetical protein
MLTVSSFEADEELKKRADAHFKRLDRARQDQPAAEEISDDEVDEL